MENLLLITTTQYVINEKIMLLGKAAGTSNHWILNAEEIIPLSEINTSTEALVLLFDESKPLNSQERSLLSVLLHQKIIHWIWHKEERHWRDWLVKNKTQFLEHLEHSQRGPTSDFLRQWYKKEKATYRRQLVRNFADRSCWQSIEMLKRNWLNEAHNQTLVRIGQRLQVGATLNFVEELLLKDYPDVASKLLAFEQDYPVQNIVYHQIRLANYLYEK